MAGSGVESADSFGDLDVCGRYRLTADRRLSMRWPHRWTKEHRQESAKDRALCKARRVVRALRVESREYKQVSFSDRWDKRYKQREF
jgi:hypothetical protein